MLTYIVNKKHRIFNMFTRSCEGEKEIIKNKISHLGGTIKRDKLHKVIAYVL